VNWVCVAAAPHRRDTLRLARRFGLERPGELAAAETERTADGIVVIGDDGDLARVALARLGREDRLPLALLPTGRSDLLRMFAIDRSPVGDGAAYRADLGLCTFGGVTVPFVSHVVSRGHRSGVVTIASGRSWQVEGWRCVVANAQHLAGDTVAPRSALMDGELDVQVHGGRRRGTRRLIGRGLHLSQPTVWRRSLATASITPPANWMLIADGRPVGSGPCSVRAETAAFDIWI
jgi:hypothetical protein